MKKIHTPNQKLYEQYYLDQAKQKGVEIYQLFKLLNFSKVMD